MQTALLVIHLMVAAALVTVVLFQQSEGGALGMGGGGGGGGGGGFLSGRGTANLLTRVTATLALAFFCTSIMLTILANRGTAPTSILDATTRPGGPVQSGPQTGGTSGKDSGTATGVPSAPSGGPSILDQLKKGDRRLPKVPTGQ